MLSITISKGFISFSAETVKVLNSPQKVDILFKDNLMAIRPTTHRLGKNFRKYKTSNVRWNDSVLYKRVMQAAISEGRYEGEFWSEENAVVFDLMKRV